MPFHGVRFIALIFFVLCCLPAALTPRLSLAQTVKQISLPANDLVYDAPSDRIYVSVPSRAGSIGNSITRIKPSTGMITGSVFIGSEPNRLALSTNGQYLYVALDGAAAVRRYTLASQSAGLQFALGQDSFSGPYYARDIAVVPGSPESVAVNRSGVTRAGVAIFDNGVPRPDIPAYPAPPNNSLAFGSASRLYSYNNSDTGYDFSRLDVSASGVALRDSAGAVVAGFYTDIFWNSGLIFATNGQVLNPETLALTGRFAIGNINSLIRRNLAFDDSANRVYFLSQTVGSAATILAFDRTTFLPVGAFAVPGASGTPSNLIHWGAHGLAFRTVSAGSNGTPDTGQIFVVDADEFAGLQSVTLNAASAPGGVSVMGTVTLTRPAPASGVKVSLVSTDIYALTVPETVTVPAGQTSATFAVATQAVSASVSVGITASWGVQIRQAAVSVLNSGQSLTFPTYVRMISLFTRGLAYHPDGKIYVSLPSLSNPQGNSVAWLDPVTGAVETPIFAGSEPGKLAISGDGQFVYAGLDGAAAVRRLDTTTQTMDAPFTLGNEPFYGARYPKDLKVVPGNGRAVAVSRRYPGLSPEFAGIAIFDDGVPRANTTPGHTGGDYLAFGATAGRLYGATDGQSPPSFFRINVSASGVVNADSVRDLVGGPIFFDGGRIYDNTGKALDPEARTVAGTFTGLMGSSLVAPDAARGKVYFLTDVPSYANGPSTVTLKIYDAQTFLPLRSISIPQVYGTPNSLTLCGPNRLAFRTNPSFGAPGFGQVFIVNVVTPVAPRALSVSPSAVYGGQPATGTVTLAAPAPAGGQEVVLSSSKPSVAAVPARVIVPAGAVSAPFVVTTFPVSQFTSCTLSAASAGVTQTAAITVQIPTLRFLTLTPATVRGGHQNSVGTVTLIAPAAAGGTVVTLSSQATWRATVPASVTVAVGQTTATFTITTKFASSTATYAINAMAGGMTRSAILTTTP